MSEEPRDAEAAPAESASDTARCFLCGRQCDVRELIDAGEGIDLCVGCGAIYASPGGCC